MPSSRSQFETASGVEGDAAAREQHDLRGDAPARQAARRHEAVAAVVAGTAEDEHQRRQRAVGRDHQRLGGRRHGRAGLLHEPLPGRAQALGAGVGAAHLRGGHRLRARPARASARVSASMSTSGLEDGSGRRRAAASSVVGSRVVVMSLPMVGAPTHRGVARADRRARVRPRRLAICGLAVAADGRRQPQPGVARRVPRSRSTMRPRSQRVVCSKGDLGGVARGVRGRDTPGAARTSARPGTRRSVGGARRQTVAPSSMEACVQVAGSSRATSASASACSARRRRAAGRAGA